MGIVFITDFLGVAGQTAPDHPRCSPPNFCGDPAPDAALLYVRLRALAPGHAASQARNELFGLRMRAPEAAERDGSVVDARRVQLMRIRREPIDLATAHRLAAIRSGAARRRGRDPHVQSRKARCETRNACENICRAEPWT